MWQHLLQSMEVNNMMAQEIRISDVPLLGGKALIYIIILLTSSITTKPGMFANGSVLPVALTHYLINLI